MDLGGWGFRHPFTPLGCPCQLCCPLSLGSWGDVLVFSFQADTQMQHPGRVSFKFIDKMKLNDSVCYVKAAFPLLGKILQRTEFKENSSNAKKMQMVRRMYSRIDENVDPCIREEDDEERELSQMCFEEFTTSPYEMLVLVKQFFQDINQLLENRETFEKDCSQVYRRTCWEPKRAGSSPGVGTDPDCNCLSPALPSATQPSLSAATRAGREVAPASTRVPYATLADLEAPSQPPASTEGGSGTEEVLGAGVGDTASVPSPAMPQTAPSDSAEAPLDVAGTLSLVAVDVSVLRGDGELVEGANQAVAGPPPTTAPRASPSAGLAGGGARIRPAETSRPVVTQLRYSRMSSGLRGGPGDGVGARGWGLSRLREPEDGGAGPSFDSGFVLGAEQRRKEPAVREGHREPLIYVTVASVVAVLLATGGLLFYKCKSRVSLLALQGTRECPELETQDL
uniref:Colony stimulating factor 1 n=1 Tax=Calidris pygmaea TaxID=425635 RepID=A0A8C3KJ23_9CHAR